MKSITAIVFFLLTATLKSYSQSNNSFVFFAGYGYYEGITAGALYNFSSNTQFIALSIGVNKLFNNKSTYFSVAAEYNISIFREKVTNYEIYKKKGLKIQLWTVNGTKDIEEAISINPDFIQTNNLDYFLSYTN